MASNMSGLFLTSTQALQAILSNPIFLSVPSINRSQRSLFQFTAFLVYYPSYCWGVIFAVFNFSFLIRNKMLESFQFLKRELHKLYSKTMIQVAFDIYIENVYWITVVIIYLYLFNQDFIVHTYRKDIAYKVRANLQI